MDCAYILRVDYSCSHQDDFSLPFCSQIERCWLCLLTDVSLLIYLQVDEILEQLSVFWANTEVVLDLLTKKGQHAEQFIGFATKPRLMARFRERLEEYKRFWENVSMMCSNYIAGVQTTNDTQRMYGFLEAELTGSVSSLTGTPTTTSKSARGGSLSGNPASQSPAGYGPTMSPQTAAAATSVHTRPSGVSGVGAGGNPGIAGAGSAFSYASPVRN